MNKYFPEPYERFGGNVKAELGLSNYATKAGLEGETEIDTSMLALKTDFASLKIKIYNFGVDILKTVPVDLS